MNYFCAVISEFLGRFWELKYLYNTVVSLYTSISLLLKIIREMVLEKSVYITQEKLWHFKWSEKFGKTKWKFAAC